jgi:hypothetical protein
VLRLEGFLNIEPQAPLGGGDDGADILCDRGRRRWVCAVYFPLTPQEFKDIESKFTSDLGKAKSYKRQGIVFVTNQRLTRDQRQTLVDIALKEIVEVAVMKASGAPNEPSITPPKPAELPKLMEALCAAWRDQIQRASTDDAKLTAMAVFYSALQAADMGNMSSLKALIEGLVRD